ncbi:GNAT family N-acetyltransferase [Micromonospora sp. NPDC005161]
MGVHGRRAAKPRPSKGEDLHDTPLEGDAGRLDHLQTLDLNRVQAETDTRNVASARVLEKLGFVREGTLREDCVVNGEVSDSWVYGLIRREWPTRKGHGTDMTLPSRRRPY